MFSLGLREIFILLLIVAGLIVFALIRRRFGANGKDDHVESFERCAVCGTYISPTKARNCGRSDCPYPAGG